MNTEQPLRRWHQLTHEQRVFLLYYLPIETVIVLGMFVLSAHIQHPFPLISVEITGILGCFIGLRIVKRGNTYE
jgi:hypothetical protein